MGLLLTAAYYPRAEFDNSDTWEDRDKIRDARATKVKTLAYIGGILAGSGWICSIVRPVIYTRKYNRSLGKALSLAEHIEYNCRTGVVSFAYGF